MPKEIRFGVTLIEGVQTVEELEAVLPPPWQCHYRTKRDATGIITCVAAVGHDISEKELCQNLTEALGNADFEWEEIED